MKKRIALILVLVLVLTLVGYSNAAVETNNGQVEKPAITSAPTPSSGFTSEIVPSFSYKEEIETWKENDPGVYYDGFKNVSKIELKDTEDIIERAKNECTVSYDTTKVKYDSTEDMWMIVFYTDGMVGGDQAIYLDGFGITHLIVYGE